MLQKILNPGFWGHSAALLAGMLLTLAFAPFHLFPLAVISLALLLALWLYVPPRQAFFRGWLFGVGLFSTGIYWIFISIHTYGNTQIPLAFLLVALFISFIALFPALVGFLLNRFFPYINQTKILCAFPTIWLFLEWVRSWIFSGFPWFLIGASQIHSPLKGYAPIFSVFGVSFAILLSAGLLVNACRALSQNKTKLVYCHTLALIFLWGIGGLFSFIHWTTPVGSPITVSLIQGNIPEQMRWSAEQEQETLKKYMALTEPHWTSHLIIWPESAIPSFLQKNMAFLNKLDETARKNNAVLITGIPILSLDQSDAYYNAVIAMGRTNGIYFKRRLVPFGEYLPLARLLRGLIHFFDIPMSNFIPGQPTKHPIMANSKIKLATFICYEITFPEQVAYSLSDAHAILTVTNDGWFGHSIAQAQHLEMAQMRAIETGRPILFAADNGITAIIDPQGHITNAILPYKTGVLTGSFQPVQGKTPWLHMHMDPLLIIMTLLLLIAIRLHKR